MLFFQKDSIPGIIPFGITRLKEKGCFFFLLVLKYSFSIIMFYYMYYVQFVLIGVGCSKLFGAILNQNSQML